MCDHTLTRRLFGGIVLAGAVGLAGCSGDEPASADPPDPVVLGEGKACDVCGMIIEGSYGPNGQVDYDGDYPPDRDGPAYYDSVRELYFDRFARQRRGIEPIVTYVTDYASVDYDVETRDGDRYITGSVAPETFLEADEAVYVVESGVQGAMGADLLPFDTLDAADSFVETHGGRVVSADDVTRELVESLR